MERKKVKRLRTGFRDSFPILLGYIPIGLAFGVLSSNADISFLNTSLMSILVFAGASQFIAVGLIEKGISVYSIILTTFLVNSRHILMSASLSPYFKKINNLISAILSFGVTDETFALNSVELKKDEEKGQYYVFGVHVTAYLAWVLSSFFGAFLGGRYVTSPGFLGLDFALPAMFIALLVIQVTDKLDIIVIIASFFVSITLLPFLGGELTLIITTILASTVGVVLER